MAGSNRYQPNCDVLWIGSYPGKDAARVCRKIIKSRNLTLHWPQLPKKSAKEQTINQGYQGVRQPEGHFQKGSASGWSSMWSLLKKKRSLQGEVFKTQILGPITLFGKFHAQSRQKITQMKLLEYIGNWVRHAKWQIDEIKSNGFVPLVVVDEPLLPVYMGPSSSKQAKKTLRLLKSILKKIKTQDTLIGIHCCNRISPAALIDLDLDLIHFDAIHFPSQVSYAKQKLVQFIDDGGYVAWGMIPTDISLGSLNHHLIEKDLTQLFSLLSSTEVLNSKNRTLPLKKILNQSYIAPTCGAGFVSGEQCDAMVNLCIALSKQFKTRYKLT